MIQKAFLKLASLHPSLERLVRYRNARKYWQERGGERYFQEQEAVANRTERSKFIVQETAKLNFATLLEIGCGYGKQLQNFASQKKLLVGCDFSHPQLVKAKDYVSGGQVKFVEADAARLPFQNQAFDAILSSAVILHNRHDVAQRILAEMIRVARKFLIHNEDTDVTFSRYGYDLTKTYQKMGFHVLESKPIPVAPDPSITQFTIVELPPAAKSLSAKDIPLQYH